MELLVENVVALSDYEIERNKPMPSTNHAYIQDNLAFELNVRYREHYKVLPEISLDTPNKGSMPDLAVYPKFTIDVRQDIIRREDPPLLAIEILSPEQNLQELIEKTDRYFAFGVKSCWIVVPSLKTVIVYSGIDIFEYYKGNATLTDPILGFELNLKAVFE